MIMRSTVKSQMVRCRVGRLAILTAYIRDLPLSFHCVFGLDQFLKKKKGIDFYFIFPGDNFFQISQDCTNIWTVMEPVVQLRQI